MAFKQRQFEAWCPIEKAVEDGDDWVVSGPVADIDQKDFDGETLVKAGVMRGLETFKKLGAHVDFEHLYPKTHDLKYLIGKGIEVTEVNGRPWLTVRLHKAGPGAEIARKVWDSVKAGIRMGFSIWGSGTKDVNDQSRIIDTKIFYVTIAPTPKGFGQFLQAGRPASGLYAIAKCLTSDDIDPLVGVESDWSDVPDGFKWPGELNFVAKSLDDDNLGAPAEGGASDSDGVCPTCGGSISKSLVTGNGIVAPGDTGGAALRTQNLTSSVGSSTIGDDDEVDKKKRKRKRKLSATKQIAKALSIRGVRNSNAVAGLVIARINSL